jgi:uncharacterized coiled-coil protein SlyX
MKNAYIYVDPKNFPDVITNAVNTPFNGSTIYIYPHTLLPKTCNICGNHSHTTDKCDDTNFTLDRNNRKIFNKRIIQREVEKIIINDDCKTKFNHVISLNSSQGKHNISQPNNWPNESPQKFNQRPQSSRFRPNYKNYNTANQDLQYTPSTSQNNSIPNNKAMEDRIQQLETQVAKLTDRITQLENVHKNTDSKVNIIQKHFNTMEENLNTVNTRQNRYDEIVQKLTENLTKLSDTVINNAKITKTSKRSSPYEKTSYEQTKKIHNLRSNKQKRTSADDSETCPQTEDDTEMQHELAELSDNATFNSIIEPDANYKDNDNTTSSSYGYNLFNFGSRK